MVHGCPIPPIPLYVAVQNIPFTDLYSAHSNHKSFNAFPRENEGRGARQMHLAIH